MLLDIREFIQKDTMSVLASSKALMSAHYIKKKKFSHDAYS